MHTRTTSQALLDLADAGDEAKARERIAFLKKAVKGGHTKANDRPLGVGLGLGLRVGLGLVNPNPNPDPNHTKANDRPYYLLTPTPRLRRWSVRP